MGRKVIKASISIGEIIDTPPYLSITNEQIVLHILKKKGIVVKGSTCLEAIGELKMWYDPKDMVTYYELIIEEEG